MNLKGKSFLKLLDFSPEEIEGLLDLAADLKAKKQLPENYRNGKNNKIRQKIYNPLLYFFRKLFGFFMSFIIVGSFIISHSQIPLVVKK